MKDNINNSNEQLSQNNNRESNKPIIFITIGLILVLIVFFAGYAIANSKNIEVLNNSYDLYTVREKTPTKNTLASSGAIEEENEEEHHITTTTTTNSDNLTGTINTVKNDNVNLVTGNITGMKNPVYNDDSRSKEKDTSNIKETKPIKTNSTTKTTSNKNNTKTTSDKNTTKEIDNAENPRIYNMDVYEKASSSYVDPYVSEKNPFVIQIATHNQLESAQHIRDILVLDKQNAYIVKVSVDGEIKYRIRVGAYATKQAVIEARNKLIKESKIKGIEKSIILEKRKFD